MVYICLWYGGGVENKGHTAHTPLNESDRKPMMHPNDASYYTPEDDYDFESAEALAEMRAEEDWETARDLALAGY